MTELEKIIDNFRQTHARILAENDRKWEKKYAKLEQKMLNAEATALAKAEKKMARKLAAAHKVLGEISTETMV